MHDWTTKRAAKLDSLVGVHGRVTGGKPGRQWATDQFNLSMYAMLAAEYQGFCRDLHDEAAVKLSDSLAVPGAPTAVVILSRTAFTAKRQLDKGNAQPGSLGSDFAQLGIQLWASINARYPVKGARWNQTLTDLNKLRNGVAHSDEVKINEVRANVPLNHATWKKWRSTLGDSARGLDAVIEAYLVNTTGNGW